MVSYLKILHKLTNLWPDKVHLYDHDL